MAHRQGGGRSGCFPHEERPVQREQSDGRCQTGQKRPGMEIQRPHCHRVRASLPGKSKAESARREEIRRKGGRQTARRDWRRSSMMPETSSAAGNCWRGMALPARLASGPFGCRRRRSGTAGRSRRSGCRWHAGCAAVRPGQRPGVAGTAPRMAPTPAHRWPCRWPRDRPEIRPGTRLLSACSTPRWQGHRREQDGTFCLGRRRRGGGRCAPGTFHGRYPHAAAFGVGLARQ